MTIQHPPKIPSLHQIGNMAVWLFGLIVTKLFNRSFTPAAPIMLMVEPTTACQLKCPHCPTGRGELSRPAGTMTYANFQRIWDSISPAPFLLQLWNQGEPLASKHTPDIIRHAARSGSQVVMSTNVELLAKGSLAEEIVASGLHELILSLDGATPESHSAYRVGGKFDLVEKGIKEVVAARKKLGVKHPLITWQFLLFKHNLHEIEQAKRLAKEWGADRIVFKTVQLEAFEKEEGEQWLPDDPKLRRYELKGDRWVLKRKERPGCKRIYGSAVIQWNGTMAPCCFDKDGDFIVGNVLEDGFNAVWKGKEFQQFRDRILKGERPEMCSNCTEGLPKLYSSPK